ncbi:hypothetical protein TrLO_g5507 [Triparma laevis f. longispina]|uniref:Uncharacterized protein n=1 Tax=Triparma laevis f. longispina TaxID=1714387 RepID=A0A9W7FGJ0_9STRA|nr:hypothetical protein TrLO_g5507 [Triparma laevis f. longispina]
MSAPPNMQRRQTVQSAAALSKLAVLDTEISQFEASYSNFSSVLSSSTSTIEQLTQTRNECRQWSGNLEKFQYVKVDSIITAELSTGKDEAKAKRKELNKHCEELRSTMEAFVSSIEAAIQAKS